MSAIMVDINEMPSFSTLADFANYEDSLDGFDPTEDGVALAFTQEFHDRLRYCHSSGLWFEWTGVAWRRDSTKRAFSWARQVCRKLAHSGRVTDGEKRALAKAAAAAAVEKFAQADQAFAVTAAIWDADPFLLGTPAGTVDLRTGVLRKPMQEDYITKLVSGNCSPRLGGGFFG